MAKFRSESVDGQICCGIFRSHSELPAQVVWLERFTTRPVTVIMPNVHIAKPPLFILTDRRYSLV